MRLWFLVVFVLFAARPALAVEDIDFMRCPEQTGQALSGFDILDGPPANKEDLLPDDDGWDIQAYRASGHRIYLVCHYGSGDKQFALPANIDFCSQEGDNVSCR